MSSFSPEDVFVELRNACSQNPELIKGAEMRLQSWEVLSGFHSVLLQILLDYSLDYSVRWQSVLYFKNGVERYWRKTLNNRISEEEKASLRKGLLECLAEPVTPIALQIAVLIGKVARFDVPKEWKELLPSLTQGVQSQDSIVQHRALLILHHTIKNLATKRLAADRRVFHDMVEEILPFVLQLWQAHHANFIQQASTISNGVGPDTLPALEKSILAMKVLRKAIVQGLRKPHENADAVLFLTSLHEQAKLVLEYRLSSVGPLKELLEKYAVLHLKILHDVLETHPFSFISVLKQTLEFLCSLCYTPQGEHLIFPRFVIFSLNIMKQVLLCMEYRPPKRIEEMNKESNMTLEGHRIKKEFFLPAIVTEICKRLIAKYLPLSPEDLTLWDNDPEEYACEDGGDSWKYSYRPCCETAFLTLFHEYREVLAPVLTDLVRENCAPVEPSNLNGILYKDAVYNAVGLAAFDLYEEIDFDQWLLSGLEAELAQKNSNYRIIRRRVVWLIGQWSGVKLSPDLRPKLYQLLLPLLQSNEDLVVRIGTAKSLKVVIDDFEFSCEELEPFLGIAFGQLFSLLKEVQECDTKLSVLNVLSFLIERMGTSIRPYCTDLLQYLPSLWDASLDHNMLRCSILTTLVFIVQGMGTIVESMFPSFLQPIIRLSTDITQQCSVYLLEDGLELWLNVLYNTKHMTEPLFALTSNIPPLLELGSENLRTVLYIVHAYILLSPTEFINTIGQVSGSVLQSQYADLQDEGALLILRLMELVLKAGPVTSPNIFKSLILCSVRAVYQGEKYPMLMSIHLSILSRLLLSYPKEFSNLSVELSNELQLPHDEVAGRILDVWIKKMPCVTDPPRRKLLSLALSSLLTSGSSVVLDKIYGILINVTETLNDITTPDNNGGYIDSLLTCNQQDEYEDIDHETEHDCRKRALSASDSVHTVDLREYFQAQINGLGQQIGENRYSDLMSNVDVETMANMKEFITI